ncbi:MAG: bifunctional demethylmenaquinone methyltransferase/2-methoxy-6-polyprenyl-1,4-benzoquinol methylase UbiE [Gammaproteobacteria bacterium]|nr:bifunctional demethylmenaquinone methyltransferase/2-methoxy-6-polyprenyl-1,4-benzoquinol methylase UbiE [Gammaproteobacteria bacterium]
MSKTKGQSTHFGYQQVPLGEKIHKVKEVFQSVAGKYDLMNDLMSLGAHRLWKKFTIDLSSVKSGQHVLDLAGGTGDLAEKFASLVGDTGKVVLADINDAMLQVGRRRLIDKGFVGNVEYAQVNAECLPFENNTFDCVTIAFGLRNVTDKDKALRSIYRVLKPGGKLLVLEFSKVTIPVLATVYEAYSFNVIPKIGKLITGDEQSYQYLVESIKRHPDQGTLLAMMKEACFESCEYFNMSGGVVALHKGYKY